DSAVLQTCINSQWSDQYCQTYCDATQTPPACAAAANVCTSGSTRCSPTNNAVIQSCVSGQWADQSYCQTYCDATQNPPACATPPSICTSGDKRCSPTNDAIILCTSGDKRCSPTNDAIIQSCVSGQWADQTYCQTYCDATQTPVACAAATPPTDLCTSGDKRCSPTNDAIIQSCVSGQWADQTYCQTYCDATQTPVACAAATPSITCISGTRQCSPTDANILETCVNSQWVDQYCLNGCNASAVPPACTGYAPGTCVDNDLRCSADSSGIEVCASGTWLNQQPCPYGCDASTAPVSCKGYSPPGGSGYPSGYNSGLVGSGGGSLSQPQSCASWASATMTNQQVFSEDDNAGHVRNCTNATYVQYCMSGNSIDTSIKNVSSQVECGAWVAKQENCSYVLSGTISKNETSGASCRACRVSTYVFQCGANAYPDQTRESSSCADWTPCKPANQTATIAVTQAGLFDFLNNPLALIAILLIVIVVAALLYFFVFKKKAEEE
ncbi:MAG: hypothetical protein V1728_05035, partial [Candidatus Micrarchaeota archaeon]